MIERLVASFTTDLSSIYRRYRVIPLGRRCAVCLGNSNDQDRGVVPKLAAAEVRDTVQQATVKRLRRQLTVAARGVGQALFAKLLAVSVTASLRPSVNITRRSPGRRSISP